MNCSTQASLFITVSRSPPKSMFIESVMPSNHLILCRPLLLLPSPASGSFPVSQLSASGGQRIGASASGIWQKMQHSVDPIHQSIGDPSPEMWGRLFLQFRVAHKHSLISLVTQTRKNPPAKAGDWGSIPRWGRSPGEGNAWRNPWTEEPGGPQSMRSERVRHD